MQVTPTDAWALLALAIVLAAGLFGALRRGPGSRLPPGLGWMLAGLLLLASAASAVWPVLGFAGGGLTWASWVRGIAGDLSATTVVLVVAWAWLPLPAARPAPDALQPGRSRPLLQGEALWLRLAVVATGWPLVLGHLLTDRLDLYRLGHDGAALPLVLFVVVLALGAAAAGAWRSACALAAALAAWGLALMESSNLWDALLDPWLLLWATGSLLLRGLQAARMRRSLRLRMQR